MIVRTVTSWALMAILFPMLWPIMVGMRLVTHILTLHWRRRPERRRP